MSLRSYRNLNQIATLEPAWKKDGRHLTAKDLGLVEKAAIVFNDKEILWVGKDSEFPQSFQGTKVKSYDLSGKILMPEMVDAHTHLIFGGDRATEYSMRLNGADYEEIGKKGGGILSTMKATKESSTEQLYLLAQKRIEKIHSYGVGTIEIKSGYALDYEGEKRLSLLIDQLKKEFWPRVQIINTYMAAHAVPQGFPSSRHYLDKIVIPLMHELAQDKIIDAVDIFHERNYFSGQDTQYLFREAQKLKLPLKSHADEFQDNGGAALAVDHGALSADHLLCTGPKGVEKLAHSSTVATLLPGTGFFLGKPQAKAQKFLEAGCKVAMASDYNPGSCHWDNFPLIAALAAPQYSMNQAQLWAAITLNAAHALGLKNQGALIKGLTPRFSLFQAPSLDHITYHWSENFAQAL